MFWEGFWAGVVAVLALAIAILGATVVFAQDHHPPTPMHYQPEAWALIQEDGDGAVVEDIFRGPSACVIAQRMADVRGGGDAAFCVPPAWLSMLPPELAPSVSPELAKRLEERGEPNR